MAPLLLRQGGRGNQSQARRVGKARAEEAGAAEAASFAAILSGVVVPASHERQAPITVTSGRPSGRPFILCGTVGLLPIITVPGSENQGGCNGSTPIRTPYPPQLAGEGRAPSVGLFAHVAAAPQQARDCRFADAQRIGDLPGSLPVVETAAEALDQVCGPFPRAARSALLWTARCGHASQDITLSFCDKLLVALIESIRKFARKS